MFVLYDCFIAYIFPTMRAIYNLGHCSSNHLKELVYWQVSLVKIEIRITLGKGLTVWVERSPVLVRGF